jgi:hypothetical protein
VTPPVPSTAALAEALRAAGDAHHEYEQVALRGERDELWAGFYAAFVIGRLGGFATVSRLAALLAAVDAPSDWAGTAAADVAQALDPASPR